MNSLFQHIFALFLALFHAFLPGLSWSTSSLQIRCQRFQALPTSSGSKAPFESKYWSGMSNQVIIPTLWYIKKNTHWCTCVYLLYFVSHNVSKRIRHVVDFQCPCLAWKAVSMTLFRTASLSLTYRHASRTDVHIILHIVQSYYFQVPQNADTVELTQFGGGSAH